MSGYNAIFSQTNGFLRVLHETILCLNYQIKKVLDKKNVDWALSRTALGLIQRCPGKRSAVRYTNQPHIALRETSHRISCSPSKRRVKLGSNLQYKEEFYSREFYSDHFNTLSRGRVEGTHIRSERCTLQSRTLQLHRFEPCPSSCPSQ